MIRLATQEAFDIHRQTGDYIKTVATSKIRNASKRSD